MEKIKKALNFPRFSRRFGDVNDELARNARRLKSEPRIEWAADGTRHRLVNFTYKTATNYLKNLPPDLHRLGKVLDNDADVVDVKEKALLMMQAQELFEGFNYIYVPGEVPEKPPLFKKINMLERERLRHRDELEEEAAAKALERSNGRIRALFSSKKTRAKSADTVKINGDGIINRQGEMESNIEAKFKQTVEEAELEVQHLKAEVAKLKAEGMTNRNPSVIFPPTKLVNGTGDGKSVECLQDRIIQMEETHHSTNEELQATLQELADLQKQLSDLQEAYRNLEGEKNVLIQSLFQQTDKLDDTRTVVATLRELLLNENMEGSSSDREQKLVDLLKAAHEEREALYLKQEELNNQLAELRNSQKSEEKETSRLEERIAVLEGACDAVKAERKQLETELDSAREELSSLTIDINRKCTTLEHAKAKINDLEQARSVKDKSKLEAIIDASRKEKDLLEAQVENLQEKLSRAVREINKQSEQIQQLMEELKVSRNNAKMAKGDLTYQFQKEKAHRLQLAHDLQEKKELINELQIQVSCHSENKEELKSVLDETQKSLGCSEKKILELEKLLNDEIKGRLAKTAEWEQFQNDLLVTVRVANELKTEAQSQLEVLSDENSSLKEKLKTMETQIEKFKAKTPAAPILSDTSASILRSVEQDLASRRSKTGIRKQDDRLSVKNLIESIESVTKQAKAAPNAKTSTSSLDQSTSGEPIPISTPIGRHFSENDIHIPTNTDIFEGDKIKDTGEVIEIGERRNSCGDINDKDPLQRLVKQGGSKRNALLKWCQNKTVKYKNIDITNFSTSWNDGLALCALLHTYRPDLVPYNQLSPMDATRNFAVAFTAAEAVGIPTTDDIAETFRSERPDWKPVMNYITTIYKFLEG